jgi:signal transduction histidine kinase
LADDEHASIPTPIDDVTTQPVALQRQILIVDDVPANLLALEVALAPLGHSLVRAGSGKEALARLLENDFSLVLLDVQMPGIDGFETASLIRSRERNKHLPIIFITAHEHDLASVRRAYQLGAVDFLHKPIDADILLAKASVFVTLQERTEELARERMQHEFDRQRRDYETESLRRQMHREHAAREELAQANQALAEADQRKDSFLAILGHELRNPLAPLRTAIDLIRAAPNEPLSARTLEVLDRQTAMLSRLVEDLLDISRISANKIELRPERLDLRSIVEAAIATSKPAIEKRSHTLEVKLPPARVDVVADHVRLVQVVTNLLNNAARYTELGGQITIECGAGRDRAFVRVTDTGIGIPAELLPRVFDMFVQERARSDGSGGLGLGLALARQLVDMHHGTIEATSPGRGRGSTFEILLPRADADDVLVPRTRSDAIEPLPRPAEEPKRPHLRAVVIDDNADACDMLAELLRSQGHEVLTACDGHAGLALICEHRPDVALVDLGLPGLDGVALVERLRAQRPQLATRLVALTGYGHSADRKRTADAGFHAHLVKPASAEVILSTVAALAAG